MNVEQVQTKISQLENLATNTKQASLRQTVTDTLSKYYAQLEPHTTTDVYNLVLAEVEEPLLQETIKLLNQSRAAIVLGLSRGTLRKLLKKYDMDNTHKKVLNTDNSASAVKQISLRQVVAETVKRYYEQAKNTAANVYEMVLAEIEDPLLRETIKFTDGNQSRAAMVLGLSRGTLRKLLKKYALV